MYDDEPTALPTFFVFAGYTYYAEGGVRDFRSAHTDLDEAEKAARALVDRLDGSHDPKDWAHVAELTAEGLSIVTRFGRG